MNRGILWLFILLALVGSVYGLNVGLQEPLNGASSSGYTVNFRCVASQDTGETLSNITLRLKSSGVWYNIQTKEATNFNPVDYTYTFPIGGSYLWNCLAKNTLNQEFYAPTDYSLIVSVNNPPVITPLIPNQNKSLGTDSWILDLSSYKSDENPSTCMWNVSGVDTSKLTITINGNFITFNRITTSATSDVITFILTDSGSLTDTQDITVYFYSTSGGSATEICNNDIDDDGDGNKDCQDSDCPSGVGSCQDAVCNSTSFDWQYTKKSSVECDSDDDCSSDDCNSDCTCEPESSSDEEETTTTDNEEETVYSITSHSPEANKVTMSAGASKTFSVETSGDATVNWYIDEKEVDSGESYTFKPDKEGEYEIVALIGGDLKNNDDFYSWTVTVGAGGILGENICGNNKADSGENCENCARDVKCAEDEECVNKECVKSSTGIFSSLSGYAVKTKDFVVKKWKYSSIIGGVIVILIIIGLVLAGKRRKKDVLYGFGKESFFSKIGKIFKKKGYITKKVDAKPVVEKQAEFYIDKKTFDDNNKL